MAARIKIIGTESNGWLILNGFTPDEWGWFYLRPKAQRLLDCRMHSDAIRLDGRSQLGILVQEYLKTPQTTAINEWIEAQGS